MDDWTGRPVSERYRWGAGRAIDGNKHSKWEASESNSISLTGSRGADAWWKMTFPEIHYIDSIVIWNRLDALASRISDVSVKVGDALIGKVTYKHGQEAYCFEKLGVLGKEITLQASADLNHPLQLVEVEVFGDEVNMKATSIEIKPNAATRELACTFRQITRTMKITWSGWGNTEEEAELFTPEKTEYDAERKRQVGKLSVDGAAITEDKTYTCTLQSEQYLPSESLSMPVHLWTYRMQCFNKKVYEGWSTILSCTISGLSETASVEWEFESKVRLRKMDGSLEHA